MKVLVFFGTRPEAIKMVPVIKSLKRGGLDVQVGLSGQHTDMVQEILQIFDEQPNFSLKIQSLAKNVEDTLALTVPKLCEVLRRDRPDLILVHGDTSSTLAGALAGFYEKIPVGHVEAGLRSHDYKQPWPEEMNRKLTASLASYHFAPTNLNRENLIQEGIPSDSIFITGNTVIDALKMTMNLVKENETKFSEKFNHLDPKKKWILVTGHRRENLGQGLNQFVKALLKISERKDVEIIFPVHPNPQVRASFQDLIDAHCPIHLINPLPYTEMIWLLSKSALVITDSGGIQEEAPSFKVPVIVTRETTERNEAVQSGWAQLVGTDTNKIVAAANYYLNSEEIIQKLSQTANPFGDGLSSQRITELIQSAFKT